MEVIVSGEQYNQLNAASPTFKDINISFNYPPYHSMSRDNDKIVINKQ